MLNSFLRQGAATLAVSISLVLFATVATAGPIHFYGELLTSRQMPGLSNVRAYGDVGFNLANPYDIALHGNIDRRQGIGNGYVRRGQRLTYTHSFQPSAIVGRILGASLWVATVDDGFDSPEAIRISLDNTFFARGRATFAILGGWVSAALFDEDGEISVKIRATRGDTNIIASAFKVIYEEGDGGGGGQAVVPEPGAMALFFAGLGVVGIVKRQRN